MTPVLSPAGPLSLGMTTVSPLDIVPDGLSPEPPEGLGKALCLLKAVLTVEVLLGALGIVAYSLGPVLPVVGPELVGPRPDLLLVVGLEPILPAGVV